MWQVRRDAPARLEFKTRAHVCVIAAAEGAAGQERNRPTSSASRSESGDVMNRRTYSASRSESGDYVILNRSVRPDQSSNNAVKVQHYPMDECAMGTQQRDFVDNFASIKNRVSTLALDLGISSSVWLLGSHVDATGGFLLNHPGELSADEPGLFQDYLDDCFHRLDGPLTSASDYLRLDSSVKVTCCEVTGDQIRDLLADSGADSRAPKVREHPHLGAHVAGLTEKFCSSSSQAHDTVKCAFMRRSVLIAQDRGASDSAAIRPTDVVSRAIGAVGNVFIRLEVRQMLFPVASLHSGGDLAVREAEIVERSSAIQFIILADIEALTFKPSKTEDIYLKQRQTLCSKKIEKVSEDDAGRLGQSRGADFELASGFGLVPVHVTALSTGAKMLSSLSRVVSILAQNSEVLRQSELSELADFRLSGKGGRGVHVPYRESTLTRILQPVLEGACANHIYCCLDERSDTAGDSVAASNALRIAVELRSSVRSCSRPADVPVPIGSRVDQARIVKVAKQAFPLFSSPLANSSNKAGISRSAILAEGAMWTELDRELDDAGAAIGQGERVEDQALSPPQGLGVARAQPPSDFWKLMGSLQSPALGAADSLYLERLQQERDWLLQSLDGLLLADPYAVKNVRNAQKLSVDAGEAADGAPLQDQRGGFATEDGDRFNHIASAGASTDGYDGSGPSLGQTARVEAEISSAAHYFAAKMPALLEGSIGLSPSAPLSKECYEALLRAPMSMPMPIQLSRAYTLPSLSPDKDTALSTAASTASTYTADSVDIQDTGGTWETAHAGGARSRAMGAPKIKGAALGASISAKESRGRWGDSRGSSDSLQGKLKLHTSAQALPAVTALRVASNGTKTRTVAGTGAGTGAGGSLGGAGLATTRTRGGASVGCMLAIRSRDAEDLAPVRTPLGRGASASGGSGSGKAMSSKGAAVVRGGLGSLPRGSNTPLGPQEQKLCSEMSSEKSSIAPVPVVRGWGTDRDERDGMEQSRSGGNTEKSNADADADSRGFPYVQSVISTDTGCQRLMTPDRSGDKLADTPPSSATSHTSGISGISGISGTSRTSQRAELSLQRTKPNDPAASPPKEENECASVHTDAHADTEHPRALPRPALPGKSPNGLHRASSTHSEKLPNGRQSASDVSLTAPVHSSTFRPVTLPLASPERAGESSQASQSGRAKIVALVVVSTSPGAHDSKDAIVTPEARNDGESRANLWLPPTSYVSEWNAPSRVKLFDESSPTRKAGAGSGRSGAGSAGGANGANFSSSSGAQSVDASFQSHKDECPSEEENEDSMGADLSALEVTFLRSVSHGDEAAVTRCVGQGVDVEVRNSFGRDAMQIAARNGTVGVMKILHQNGGQLTSRGGPRSSTLFHLAAENGHIAVMQWMNSVGGISHGCDLYGQTAVHVAARRGELETIHYLHFSLDLDLAAEDFDGLTPLEVLPKHSMHGNEEGVSGCRDFLLSMMNVE
mmetsp:Transcript_12898/g.28835  ORF Transcript_12898/g.28835 Transcript_12898/m.28835 type:complete len:1467 (+) Transcript_12898:155-4555(+)